MPTASLPNIQQVDPTPLITQASSEVRELLTKPARTALINPLLEEKNHEHFAAILANIAQATPYKIMLGSTITIALAGSTANFLEALPDRKAYIGLIAHTATYISIVLCAIFLAIQYFIISQADFNFKQQALELIRKLDRNIDTLSQINDELKLSITQIREQNEIFSKSNSVLRQNIDSFQLMMKSTTDQVSSLMSIALKEDEQSKKTLQNLKEQLDKKLDEATEGHEVFLGIATNLSEVQNELKDLALANRGLNQQNQEITQEFKAIIKQVFQVQKQLEEQNFLDNLRSLARKIDAFGDDGATQRISIAIEQANEQQSSTVPIKMESAIMFQHVLEEVHKLTTEKDALKQSSKLQSDNHQLFTDAKKTVMKHQMSINIE